MKKTYLKPLLEVYSYKAEKGYSSTLGLTRNDRDRDYVLIEGNDRSSMRASEEVTEYTDEGGQFMTGEWD